MGDSNWEKVSTEWLKEPDMTVEKSEPYYKRGERFLNNWIRASLSNNKVINLKLGCGYQQDNVTNEFIGAVIRVKINDFKAIYFSCKELQRLIDFMRSIYSETNNKFGEFGEDHIKDAEGLMDALQNGIDIARKFENPTKH